MCKLIPNTFGLKASARELIEFGSVLELQHILSEHRGESIRCIGQGSNLLLTGDYDGLVLQSGMRRVLSLTEDDDSVTIDCGAGIVLDELIAQLVDMGLWGLENLSYIPGTVGASAVQNVGAYGVEAKDVITAVHTVEVATGVERLFSNEECRFGYRDSIFKGEAKGKYVVTSVTYRLLKNRPENPENRVKGTTLHAIRKEIIATRQQKLPEVNEFGSAGSFFKNPVVDQAMADRLKANYPDMPMYNVPFPLGGEDTAKAGGERFEVKLSAAWLIDQCGLKGYQLGGARVWDKQPLVIVNYTGSATADDILSLSRFVQAEVKKKMGVEILPEVEII